MTVKRLLRYKISGKGKPFQGGKPHRHETNLKGKGLFLPKTVPTSNILSVACYMFLTFLLKFAAYNLTVIHDIQYSFFFFNSVMVYMFDIFLEVVIVAT